MTYSIAGILLLLLSTVSATLHIIRSPVNLVAIVSICGVIFGILPAILYTYFNFDTFYSFRNAQAAGGMMYDYSLLDQSAFIMSTIILAFSLGGLFSSYFGKSNISFSSDFLKSKNYFADAIFMASWLFLYVNQLNMNGGIALSSMLPVVRTGSHAAQSGYIYTLFMSIPIVLYLKEFLSKDRSSARLLLFFVIGVLTCISTHQRRELITLLFIVVGAWVIAPRSMTQAVSDTNSIAKLKKFQLSVMSWGFLILGAFVPLSWYLRIWVTNITEGNSIDPFAVRGFFEVLMGSPATGFSTFTIVKWYTDFNGFLPFQLISQIFTTPIPRDFMVNKPVGLDSIIQNYFALPESPSMFWFGELYMNFGLLSVLLAFLLGFGVARAHDILNVSGRGILTIIGVAVLALSITFFKNGIYIFSIRLGVICFVLAIYSLIPKVRLHPR